MPTIIQALPSLISGEVENGTVEIAKFLVENGYQSIVLSSGGEMVEELKHSLSKHIQINIDSKNPFWIYKNIAIINKILQDYQVDIIHARSRAPAWSCYYATKNTNTRFITTVHGIYSSKNFLQRMYNSVMTKGDRVIAVSDFVKKYLLENYVVDEENIRVIPRGVDHQYYDPSKINPLKIQKFRKKYNLPEDVPIVLLPARFTNWKGQKLLIQAINKIKSLNFYCIMVGDLAKHPEYVNNVKEMIASLRLQNKIQLFGSENDMYNLYAISDIILSTSIEPEAFGRTIIEAQSMQKLVIASNIGGTSETIAHEVSGLHFISSDVSDLAETIKYSLEIFGSKTHIDMINSARESVINNYSLRSMQIKTLKVYQELL
jgi:glycosyltransferase involved in cell wall biosynthesis